MLYFVFFILRNIRAVSVSISETLRFLSLDFGRYRFKLLLLKIFYGQKYPMVSE